MRLMALMIFDPIYRPCVRIYHPCVQKTFSWQHSVCS